ncbi:hypothetical protein HaLaN_15566, partial [Haematococcus lacustris]
MREEGRQPFPMLTHLKFGGAFFNRAIAAVFPLGPLLTRVTASGFDSVLLALQQRCSSLEHTFLAPSAAFEALSSSNPSRCSPPPSPYTSSPYESLAGSSGNMS